MGSQLLTSGKVRGGCLEEESSVPGLHERAHGQIRQQKELMERHHMTLSHLGHWRLEGPLGSSGNEACGAGGDSIWKVLCALLWGLYLILVVRESWKGFQDREWSWQMCSY